MHPPVTGRYYFVHPQGNDGASGISSAQPLQTIQAALEKAYAGDTIVLLPGVYFQDFSSLRPGTRPAPIRIVGRQGAVVKGAGNTYIAQIRHDFIELHNFMIDGEFQGRPEKDGYRKKLVYIKGRQGIGIQGVRLLNMDLRNAADECVRIKYRAHHNEIGHSRISDCGKLDFAFDGGAHNGESIYIGTAPEQIAKGVNPDHDPDPSDSNWIHHNVIISKGSECVDIKEASRRNLVEYNLCSDQMDPNVGGISIRGNQNVVRYNQIFNNVGAGVRLGGDTPKDGIDNQVYGNFLFNNQGGAMKIMAEPQAMICGNTIITISNQKKIRFKGGGKTDRYLQSCP